MRRMGVGALGAVLALGLSGCGGSGDDVAQAAGESVPAAPAASGTASAPGTAAVLATTGSGGSMSVGSMGVRGSTGATNMGAFEGDGKASTVGGYSLVSVKSPKKAGQAGTLSFVVNGPSGKPQTDFTLQQTKLLHLYVVRADLTGFQHIHPTIDMLTGVWSVPITFGQPGPYRLVAEFEALTDDGNFDDRILGSNLVVPGAYQPAKYAPLYGSTSVDGYTFSLDRTATVNGPDLHLRVTKAGADVTDLQQYLQSFAHITGFRQGDLATVHVHPNETPPKTDPNKVGGPVLTLASLFTAPGNYRLFVEFQ
ncbi:MAG TPA: hypothetical protein VHV82_18735, partial [Sporichthyaceae bacterium]|nr:hypothetical protein [Sporichthyaceae bacterium]